MKLRTLSRGGNGDFWERVKGKVETIKSKGGGDNVTAFVWSMASQFTGTKGRVQKIKKSLEFSKL